ENAIDAGSTRIEIHLEEGGLKSIRIRDNGCGMDEEDCRLAFERHATSKLKKVRELPHIRTLGFRGEALPSIAAVARVEIISKVKESLTGTRVLVEGGKETLIEPAAFPQVTEVSVSDLFYNTPARLKYMKTIQTEIGNVSDLVNRLALSHPEVSFVLTHNGRPLLKTTGDGQLLHVIAEIYGIQVARNMIWVEGETLDFSLKGYIAKPEITRASRGYISTLINGRFIRNMGLVQSIIKGYHTLLPINRYPLVVLSLDMDPSLVDVNVHPAKMEVRFSKEQELYRFVEETVKGVWHRQQLIPEPEAKVDRGMGRGTSFAQPARNEYQPSMDFTFFVPSKPEEEIGEPKLLSQEDYLPPTDTDVPNEGPGLVDELNKGDVQVNPLVTEEVEEMERVPEMYPLAQLHGTYILAQSPAGLYMIDQHAAQERINYEYFLGKLQEEKVESQDLLLPLTFEFTTEEGAAVEENMDSFRQVGVFLEPFGIHTYLVRSYPRWFPAGQEESLIREMVEMILRGGKTIDDLKLREEAAISMSCKKAIKANRHLTMGEMEALIKELRNTTTPFTCPHGRPIIIHFSTYDIEKMFKRIM
ncbi:MAG TPA: DNA mismatch repair endonuclease MutL, partial [Paenibacillaceae bacterium]|nr:DNA mismatch repair endonuclease MutL [Paenibacillaceae bacterium]